MPDKTLPAQPNLEQYKKQAKDLFHALAIADQVALDRVARHHPNPQKRSVQLSDAQLVIAREHGFESWPKFAGHIEMLQLSREVASLDNPPSRFIEAACSPRQGHRSGTLEEAGMILARYPQVAAASIHTAAILADETTVRAFLARDPSSAAAKFGPLDCDALTYLCFSRYLRLDRSRSDAFIAVARALLDAGANPNTGWIEMIDHPNPRPLLETAIYGAAAVAQNPGLTRLLLERGADPNDEETAYHVIEDRDNTVLKILLDSGRFNQRSLSTALLRKSDWHDLDGLRLVLETGIDPNTMTGWGWTALHQAVRRDNRLAMIELLLDYGADPTLPSRSGVTSVFIAARRGRGEALDLFEKRGFAIDLAGVNALIAACARDRKETIRTLLATEPQLQSEVVARGGTLLAEFAGVGNLEGVRNLLDLGISSAAIYHEGDGYYGVARNSTALHVAAWRANDPDVVQELIARGAPVEAKDGDGRTALQLAVKACVDSYWMEFRFPDSVRALLEAGASKEGIELPTGYDAIDALLCPS